MRLGKVLNWLFLAINVSLCVLLASRFLLDKRGTQAARDAKGLGMDVYCAKGPFEILIDKKYSQNGNYYFCQYASPMIFAHVDDGRTSGTGAKKNVAFNLGTDFTINCSYSVENGNCRVYEMDLIKGGEGFVDLNVDGVFDMHTIFWPRDRTRLDVWYNGRWVEVDRKKSEGMGKYQHVLKEDGSVVIFDKQIGRWIPQADGKKSGTKFREVPDWVAPGGFPPGAPTDPGLKRGRH